MRNSFLNVQGTPDPELVQTAVHLGFASMLIGASDFHMRHPSRYVSKVLGEAARNKNFKVYFNEEGSPVGYVVWAFLTPDSSLKLMKKGPLFLHSSEWNEGQEAWIIDLVAPFGNVKYILADLQHHVFSGLDTLKYFRIKKGAPIFKEVSGLSADRRRGCFKLKRAREYYLTMVSMSTKFALKN